MASVRNVPGVALYMTSLTQVRTLLATSPHFARVRRPPPAHAHTSVLPSLTSQGNLIAGATTRVCVGFLLNPFSVLKARFEVRLRRVSHLRAHTRRRATYTHTRAWAALLSPSCASARTSCCAASSRRPSAMRRTRACSSSSMRESNARQVFFYLCFSAPDPISRVWRSGRVPSGIRCPRIRYTRVRRRVRGRDRDNGDSSV